MVRNVTYVPAPYFVPCGRWLIPYVLTISLLKIIDNALGSNSHIMQVIIFFVIENKMEGIAITSHHVLPGKIPQNRVNECLRLQNSQ